MAAIEVFSAFSRLMELRNFSAVAAEMGISQSTVSKHIASLEEELGVQLFVRTTRTLSPTVEASELIGRVHEFLEAYEDVKSYSSGKNPAPTGLLRVSAPVSFGPTILQPLIRSFLKKFEGVDVELQLNDAPEALLPESVDVALFSGEPTSLTMRIRTLGNFEKVVVCHKRYAAKFGVPAEPIDLEHHTIILAKCFSGERFDFESENGRQSVRLSSRFATNSELLAYNEAKAGAGITVIPSWIAETDIKAGKMLQLLADCYLPEIPIHLAYPQTKFVSLRLRAFINHLVTNLQFQNSRTRSPG